MEHEPKVKKSRNTREYTREYMARKYKEDPVRTKKYQRCYNTRRMFHITKEVNDAFGVDLNLVVKIYNSIKLLEEGTYEKFLEMYPTLDIQRKRGTGADA